jgi:hypothetical protein
MVASREDDGWHWKATWYGTGAQEYEEIWEERGIIAADFDVDDPKLLRALRAAVGYPRARVMVELYG